MMLAPERILLLYARSLEKGKSITHD